LKVWWLGNVEAQTATLKSGAPEYLRDQLSSRRGRNGRGRLWVDAQFGRVVAPRLEGMSDALASYLPGGIVIRDEDERFCVGGHVAVEALLPAPE
jgi:hypothetical protein